METKPRDVSLYLKNDEVEGVPSAYVVIAVSMSLKTEDGDFWRLLAK